MWGTCAQVVLSSAGVSPDIEKTRRGGRANCNIDIKNQIAVAHKHQPPRVVFYVNVTIASTCKRTVGNC